ncbi:MAG TPA: DUF6542 domain-containing protein [Streptosporangiaceae bacterium]|nr:DUF6542 domain-containing protein [Streptosporangiaceae bacterium]
MSGEAQRDTPRIRLTGRGAIVIMVVVFALGLLGAWWLGWPVLVGASFVAGSAAAVFYVRTRDLLVVTAVPPLVFGIVLVVVKAATATGSVALSTAEGTAITLAGVAPWLFAGMAVSLAIAWARDLRGCVRALRADLRPADQRPGSVADLGPAPVPEDEPSAPLAAPGNPQSGPAA